MVDVFSGANLELLRRGIIFTLGLFATGVVGGAVLGAVIGVLRSGPTTPLNAPLRALLVVYSAVFRGVPALVLIIFFFYGSAAFGIRPSAFQAAALALTAYASAGFGEIAYASINAVSEQQWLAGRSLGLSYIQILIHIIVPQAARVATPPAVGQVAHVLKGTSLASVIGVIDVTGAGNIMANRAAEPLYVFLVVGAVYFILGYPLMRIGRLLERRLLAGSST